MGQMPSRLVYSHDGTELSDWRNASRTPNRRNHLDSGGVCAGRFHYPQLFMHSPIFPSIFLSRKRRARVFSRPSIPLQSSSKMPHGIVGERHYTLPRNSEDARAIRRA